MRRRQEGLAVAKESGKRLESVGWVFWIVVWVILSPPLIYWAWQNKFSTTSWGIPFIIGAAGGAIGAGIISSAINAILARRVRQRQLAERKKAKKRKK